MAQKAGRYQPICPLRGSRLGPGAPRPVIWAQWPDSIPSGLQVPRAPRASLASLVERAQSLAGWLRSLCSALGHPHGCRQLRDQPVLRLPAVPHRGRPRGRLRPRLRPEDGPQRMVMRLRPPTQCPGAVVTSLPGCWALHRGLTPLSVDGPREGGAGSWPGAASRAQVPGEAAAHPSGLHVSNCGVGTTCLGAGEAGGQGRDLCGC